MVFEAYGNDNEKYHIEIHNTFETKYFPFKIKNDCRMRRRAPLKVSYICLKYFSGALFSETNCMREGRLWMRIGTLQST